MRKLRISTRLCQAALLSSLAFLGSCNASPGVSPDNKDSQLSIMRDVMQRVQKSYVRNMDDDQLTTNALKGMLSRLDPHSDYMDPVEFGELESDMQGQFGGLGIELAAENGAAKVIAPIDGTPAARAGIEPGDLIVKIDGRSTDGLGLTKIVQTLRGKPGSKVTITLARTGRDPFDVPLTREIIHVASVKSALQPDNIGYARITTFTQETQPELTEAIDRMKHQAGGHLKGFVLDLRDNPGGLLVAAVDVAGDFLQGGTVVETHGREDDDNHVYSAPRRSDVLSDVPMVVLINSASASASEIVAGALKDRGRATIMGTPSFGKGSVQSIIPIGDGAIRMTTALYYTPLGNSIQGLGIQPDMVVTVPPDEQVMDTVVTREADLRGALENGGTLVKGQVVPPTPRQAAIDRSRPIQLALIGTKKDSQLNAAVMQLEKLAAKSPVPPKT